MEDNMTDLDLMKLLESEGYEPSLENLATLKELLNNTDENEILTEGVRDFLKRHKKKIAGGIAALGLAGATGLIGGGVAYHGGNVRTGDNETAHTQHVQATEVINGVAERENKANAEKNNAEDLHLAYTAAAKGSESDEEKAN